MRELKIGMSYITKHGGEPRIIRAKGVRFNYLQFLWSRLNTIVSTAESGDYALAMKLLILDVQVLPNDIREIFEPRAKMIEQGIAIILNYQIPQLQNIPDLFIRQLLREKYLQWYCKQHYESFIKDLFITLQSKGFIEQGDYSIPLGKSHTLREEERFVEEVIETDYDQQEPLDPEKMLG